MTIYIKHFTDREGNRMSKDCFNRLCESCDWDADLVLETASDLAWVYHSDLIPDLETMVGLNNPDKYNETH